MTVEMPGADPTRDPPDGATEPQQSEMSPGAIDPQRLLRIAGVTREVLEEARRIGPEPGAVEHLRSVYRQITNELREALPPELYEELDDLTPELRGGSLEELALAHAEVLGWLQGLFQGTQLAIQVGALRAAQHAAQSAPGDGRPLPPGIPGEEPADSQYL